MLRALITASLLLLVLLHVLGLSAIRLGFEVERARIEQQFCENRDRPELGCHGRCYLRKSLQRAEETTSGLQRRKAQATSDEFLPVSPLAVGSAQYLVVGAASAWPSARTACWHDPARSKWVEPPETLTV